MNRSAKELFLLITFSLTACSAKAQPTISVTAERAPLATPTLPAPPPPTEPPLTTEAIYYPDVNLTYQRQRLGNLECVEVPWGGTMWRAALALGPDTSRMDDVDDIRLHPVTQTGRQEMLRFNPRVNPFPSPAGYRWQDIHKGSLACRSVKP